MTAEVILFNGITTLNLPADRILQKAIDANLQGVVIVGYDDEGKEYFASSYADGGTCLWLLEKLKLRLLEVVVPERT